MYIHVDIAFEHQGASTVPIEVVITKQKPDLVKVDKSNNKVTLLELSIPFETNIDSTHDIKVNRYKQLISGILLSASASSSSSSSSSSS